uniref:Ig-like domain-containing protein n=1 Tax=Denticeps clupeoides TaxID=299321 RepID=A0AAY4AYH6_9TELE
IDDSNEIIPGYMGDISVVQSPDVIASAVGQNITLDCMFHYGPEKVIHSILYWFRYKNGKREYILHNSSARYNGRIKVLHNSVDLNQSIVLLNVTWDDFGTYHCMMSYSTEQRGPERKSGGGITLLVFDHPEPFYLYALILIIPFIALIVILLAMIIRIIRNKQSDKKAEMHMMHRRTHKRHSKP